MFRDLILIWLCIFVIVMVVFAMSSCVSIPKGTPSIPVTPEIQTIIKNISWVQGILIIGVVASIFACFNGAAKLGMPLLISSLIGYGLTSAMLFYAKLIAIMSLAGGVTLCVYMIFIKSKALKEIIRGVQRYRITQPTPMLNDRLREAQSKSTKILVKKIKGKKNV